MATPNNTSGLVTNPKMKLILSDLAHFCYSPSANYNSRGSSAWHTVRGCGVNDMPASAKGKCTYAPSTWYRHAGIPLFWWNGRGPEGATVADMKAPLLKAGLVPVWWGTGEQANQLQPSQLRPGDIGSMLSSNSAHGVMWTGYEWRSDFCQGLRPYPYSAPGRGGNQTFILWRHPALQEPGVSLTGGGFNVPPMTSMIGGMFNGMFGGGGTGDMPKWQKAVLDMKSWYEQNIHNYNQGQFTNCPLLGNKETRHDCSGFVTACLKLYGINWPHSTMIPVRADCMDQSALKLMQDGGFTWIECHSMDEVKSQAQEFDILVGPGHTEIYAGNNKSYSWGNVHDLAHGGMPSATTWNIKPGPFYNSIFRCNGTGGAWGAGYGGQLDLTADQLTHELAEKCPKELEFKGLWMRYHLQAGQRSPIVLGIMQSHMTSGGMFGGGMFGGAFTMGNFSMPQAVMDYINQAISGGWVKSHDMNYNPAPYRDNIQTFLNAMTAAGVTPFAALLLAGAVQVESGFGKSTPPFPVNQKELRGGGVSGTAGWPNAGEGLFQFTFWPTKLKVIQNSGVNLPQTKEAYAAGPHIVDLPWEDQCRMAAAFVKMSNYGKYLTNDSDPMSTAAASYLFKAGNFGRSGNLFEDMKVTVQKYKNTYGAGARDGFAVQMIYAMKIAELFKS